MNTECHNIYIYWRFYGSKRDILSDWLRAGRSEIISRLGRDFPPVQTGPEVHPASCKMSTVSFPGVKCGPDVLLTTHPLLVPRSWKNRAIPLPPSGSHRACNGNTLPLTFQEKHSWCKLHFNKTIVYSVRCIEPISTNAEVMIRASLNGSIF